LTQYSTQTNDFLNTNRNIYEVNYLANGANGDIVSTGNPLPVSLGGENVIITGNVSIPGSIEVSNDIGNPLPTQIIHEGNLVSANNRFPVTMSATSSSAFGEQLSVEPTCVVQLDALYGLDGEQADQFQTYTALGGAATTEDNMFKVSSSATQYSYGVLRSKRFLRYRPGQGAVGRFVARFDTPTANTSQRAGLFNQEDALMVGYNGETFGLLHSYGAKTHIQQIQITAGPSGSSNATITLNSTAYEVPLVSGEDVYQTASRIAQFTFTGWIAEQKDDRVIFLSESVGAKNGTYSFSHASATATLTTRQSGNAATDVWYPQNQWNGEGAAITWYPDKFNVYQIQYRWLGAGIIRFCAEHPDTGDLIVLHTIHWANRYTTLTMGNPSMKIGFVAYNLGGGATTVYGGSMMLAIEGQTIKNDYPRSKNGDHTGLARDIVHHIFSVQNPITRAGKINTKEIVLQDMTVSTQGSDPVEVFLFLNPTLSTGDYDFRTIPDALAIVDTTNSKTFDIANNTAIITYTVGINGTQQFDLTDYRIILSPGDRLSIGVRSGQSISRVISSLTWVAD